jgi:cytidylate kinase
MGSVVIVSGPPASGKTTLCRALAAGCPNGVHLASDHFYDFIAHRVNPTSEESHHQNTIVIRAVASAALAYAKGGSTRFSSTASSARGSCPSFGPFSSPRCRHSMWFSM